MEIIESAKHGSKLCLNGYMYTKHVSRKTKIWWKCVKRSSSDCRGSITTSLLKEDPSVGKPHNHSPDQSRIDLAKIRNWMRIQAVNTRDKPGQIYTCGMSLCNNIARPIMPSDETCKRTIRNQRPTEPVPRNFEDLGEIPNVFTQTVGPVAKQFLLYDNGPNVDQRILIFGTTDGLKRLGCSNTIFMDGNFSMAPKPFKQIYFIRVLLGVHPITVLYALLPNKTRVIYEEMLQALVNKCAEIGCPINITTVVTDFEDGVMRAVVAIFGRNVQCKGCFYHLTMSTWRKIQELGLSVKYNTDEQFRLFCRMIDGLAFLPLEDIQEGMLYLKGIVPDNVVGAEELLTYFDETYVTGSFRVVQQPSTSTKTIVPLTMRRVPPTFKPEVWNVHEATLNGTHRTNNVCEGWNNKLFNLVGHRHPSIWRLIEWFQREEEVVCTNILQYDVGNLPQRKRNREFVQLQERLWTLCDDRRYGRKTVAEFLRGIGWNIRLNNRE